MDVGRRLKQVLDAQGKSGRALALRVGVVPSQISKIISGTTKPSLDLLERICDELGISMSIFFFDEFERDCYLAYEQIMEEINDRNLPENEKNLVLNVLGEVKESFIPYLVKTQRLNIEKPDEDLEMFYQIYKSLSPEKQEAFKVIFRSFIQICK
ncbi:helix-turn-helix domain-containing protein [Anaeroselena agilis]|uniref:Helix-turn-helix transcriptional regulator n=1 Tax=Anaeroselena agilis TaxID=3063788 RepID=A0ABU3NWC4_9FIRM|nr:helix-turn-helix transcriptional regulator [Selenomonadales bacterium 4137-cl]